MASFYTNTQIFTNSLKWILSVLLLFVITTLFAQKTDFHTNSNKAEKAYVTALKMYNMRYDNEAITSLNVAIVEDSNFLEAQLLLGQIYLDRKDYKGAIAPLKHALRIDEKNEFPITNKMLGEAELYELELQDAIAHFVAYKNTPDISKSSKQETEKFIELAFFRKTLLENPVPYDPINLGPNINSKWFEHSPTLTVDEKTIFFTRKRSIAYVNGRDIMDEDLFVSHKDADGNWGKAEALGPEINTSTNEGASAISPDGNYLFFTSCERKGGQGGCDLFIARKSGDTWIKARSLGTVINSRSWESQPTFGPDGRTLYFVKRVGTQGHRRKDMYWSKIGNNGQWTTPVSLSLNTQGDEESPFIHPDGQTFYFTSNGYPGLGGRDLFMSRIDSNGEFQEPKNLGYPINSGKDEVSLVVSANGKYAYFASGMEGGFGYWDLYKFKLPEGIQPVPVNYTKGKVYDAITKKPVAAKFEIVDLESGNIVVESFADRQTGGFLVTIPTGKEYAVNVSAKGYLFYSANFNLNAGDDTSKVSVDIPLSPIQEGVAVVLNNVFFAFNSYELKDISKFELNKLVGLLTKNPQMSIEIGGHTDNKGTTAYNQTLSENRAKSVYDYLITQGVEQERLGYKGYNFLEPIATNDTEEGRAKNRRTEFKIVKIN